MSYLARLTSVASAVVLIACLVGGVADRQRAAASGAQAGEKAAEKPAVKSNGPPPLVVDRNAPLLLEEARKKRPPRPVAGPVADNSPCYVCHANYEGEELVVVHAEENTGCVDCHGTSYPHRDDENNVTPPDVMYPPEKVDNSCEKCHAKHNVPAAEVVARWRDRCADQKDPAQIVCTDCHFQHRLKRRTVRWDKRTGKLIVRGKGPVQVAPDHGKRKPHQRPRGKP